MTLRITKAGRDRCPRCKTDRPAPGFEVEDDQGAQAFICPDHLKEIVTVCEIPLAGERQFLHRFDRSQVRLVTVRARRLEGGGVHRDIVEAEWPGL